MGTVYSTKVKRPADFTLAVLAFIVSAPLHALCALAVRATSGKPIYFCQERAGMGGSPFQILKFRTMQNGTERRSGNYPTQDMVTPIGRWLRRSSLDELPQLINIIKGDMSFVGPRPALMSQVERYTDSQRERLKVRPGITGLAQILHRNAAPWSVRIETDRQYIENVSLLGDLVILLRTLPAALRGNGQIVGQTATEVDDLPPAVEGAESR